TLHRATGQRGDRAIPEAHVQRHRIQPVAVTCLAGRRLMLVPFVPPDFLATLLFIETRHLHTGTETTLAPAMLGVEREQPWIELCEATPARRARALRGKNNCTVRPCSQYMYQPLTEIERTRQCLMQRRVCFCVHVNLCHRQLDCVLFEA